MEPSISDLVKLPPSTLKTLPAGKPPPGVIPNLTNPHSTGPILIIVATIFLALALAFYINRVYTKVFIVRRLNWDDLTITLGLIGTISMYGGAIRGVTKGPVGKHQWNVSFWDLLNDDYTVPIYLAIVPMGPNYLFIKLTFFLMYLQIFKILRWMRICIYVGAAILCAFYGAATVVFCVLTIARPGELFLERISGPPGRRATQFGIPFYSVGVVIDLYILIIPIIAVSQLQLPKRKKIGVSLIFMTGLFACVTAAINVYYRVVVVRSLDSTFVLLPTITMSIIELCIGIMCTCMPSFAKMMHHHIPPWENMRSSLYSRLGYSSRSHRGESYKKSGNTHDDWVRDSRSFDGFHGDVKGGENISLPSLDMGHPQKVQTFIETGPERDHIRDDRIHVGYQIQQQQQRGV